MLDGIHPTAAANKRIAQALLKMMEERKIRR
jgi:lysophospholipase L1-like esterase